MRLVIECLLSNAGKYSASGSNITIVELPERIDFIFQFVMKELAPGLKYAVMNPHDLNSLII